MSVDGGRAVFRELLFAGFVEGAAEGKEVQNVLSPDLLNPSGTLWFQFR